ncbi:MAG: tetratricopeptide repeat protein [Bacteroidales bacterium]|nr:tetratricopeptide repeat protein [Bacteroidales bacterium]
MKRIALFGFIIALCASGVCQAQLTSVSYDNWYEDGNAAYNEGNYEQALNFYNSIVEAGMESAGLYYNMGNTYYKMKDYPRSILYYEKALKLDPSNEDVRTNLEIANLAIVDKITPIPQSFITKWWNSLGAAFSADGWAWFSIVAFGLLLACLFLFLMSRRIGLRKTGFFVGMLTIVCLGLSLFFAFTRQKDMRVQDEAIIMTPTALVKSSPSENSVDLFVLHEGSKVRVMDGANGWNKIKIADGSVGWLQAENMIAF